MPAITQHSITPSQFSNSIPPLLQRIYAARGTTCDQQVDYHLQQLQPPNLLKNLSIAIDLLVDAVEQQKKILIVGDFDADGATSCALSLLALSAMGLRQVDFLVPNRFEFGYGLTPEIVDQAASSKPDLIANILFAILFWHTTNAKLAGVLFFA